jgi:endonuclease YncB( thermonuclease family)
MRPALQGETKHMFRTTLLAIAFLVGFSLSDHSFAHGGAVDKDGCHVDSKTGEKHCHKDRAAKKKVQTVAACKRKAPQPGEAGMFFGPVTHVIDGDSFKAKVQGVEMDFRFSDIDAPEMEQPYGPEAKATLEKLLADKDVVILPVDTDRYGRTIAHVWVDGAYANRELMKSGAAWFYTEYANGDCLYWVEQEARGAKRGLWALPAKTQMEPWEWRKNKGR